MAVSSVTNTTSGTTDLATVANKTLDKDAFLKLLVTQLQNQDPMSPMEDKDFIAQLAQFSSLEQMQQLNSGFTSLSNSSGSSQAFSMVDKWIDYADTATGTTVTGRVDGVSYENGKPKLTVGNATVDLGNVVRVYPDAGSLGQTKLSTQATAMIGKTVNYYDVYTGAAASGKVDSVSFSNGWPILNIGSEAIDARNVIGAQSNMGTGNSDVINQANSLIGRNISYTALNGTTVQGKVDSVLINSGVPALVVNKQNVDLSQVVKVF